MHALGYITKIADLIATTMCLLIPSGSSQAKNTTFESTWDRFTWNSIWLQFCDALQRIPIHDRSYAENNVCKRKYHRTTQRDIQDWHKPISWLINNVSTLPITKKLAASPNASVAVESMVRMIQIGVKGKSSLICANNKCIKLLCKQYSISPLKNDQLRRRISYWWWWGLLDFNVILQCPVPNTPSWFSKFSNRFRFKRTFEPFWVYTDA